MRLIIYILCIFLLVANCLLFSKENPSLWHVGETLTYKVTWSVFRLGTMKLTIVDTNRIDNRCIFHARLNIDSNPLLFFINQHSEYHSFFDDALNTHMFQSTENIEGVSYRTEYRFDYEDSLLSINMTDMENSDHRIKKEKRFYGKVLDGTSLLFYTRMQAAETHSDTAYYLFAGELNPAIFHFKGADKSLKIGEARKQMETLYMEGMIPGKGIAGLKGRIKCWFADHPQKTPIKGQFKVFIGNITIQLESCKACDLDSS